MIVLSAVRQIDFFKNESFVISFLIDIDGARFVTDAVFVMKQSKGMPLKNCHIQKRLNMTKLEGMEEDLDFAWPNWPKKQFRLRSVLEQELREKGSGANTLTFRQNHPTLLISGHPKICGSM